MTRLRINLGATAIALLAVTACTDATEPTSPRLASGLRPVAELGNLPTSSPALFNQHGSTGIYTSLINMREADDFVVPAGKTWFITQVVLSGLLSGDKVTFTVHRDNGGFPGEPLSGASYNLAPSASSARDFGSRDFLFTLPAPLTLVSGTYFLVVGPGTASNFFGLLDTDVQIGSEGLGSLGQTGSVWTRLPGVSPGAAFVLFGDAHVVYAFGGFQSPVAAAPALNSANAGRAVPIKFSLGGDQGLSILAAGSPTSKAVSCPSSGLVTNVDESATTSAGGGGLSYDPASDTYTYVWKTEKSWAGSCRTFVLTLADGFEHTVNFTFKK